MSPARPPDATPRRSRPIEVLVLVVGLLVLLPVLAVLITRVGRDYFPTGDRANIDMLTRDVFTAHPPLVGSYSRGFNHPGPMFFYALAPLSALTGGATWTLIVGAALVQGISIVGVGVVAFRRGGAALMLVMLAALGLAYTGIGQGGQFTEAWNPNAAFPCFLFFLLLVWAFATGDRWMGVGAAATGSFIVQAHIGYLPLVIAAVLWGAAVAFVDRAPGSGSGSPRWRTVVGWSAVVTAVMWAPPVVQQFTSDHGNLREIWRYFSADEPVLGLRAGTRILAREFAVVPPWLGGTETFAFGSGTVEGASPAWLAIPAVLLVAGYLAARRSGRRADRRLVELAALMTVVSIVVLARVSVEASPYLFYWRIIVAVFVVAASVYAIANFFRVAERPRVALGGALGLVGVIAIGYGAQLADVVNHSDRLVSQEQPSVEVMTQVRRQGLPHDPVLVRPLGVILAGFEAGLVDGLDRAGTPVRVDPELGYRFGEQRTATPDGVGEVWYAAEDGRYLSLLSAHDGARVVASWSPLSRGEERELVALQRQAAAAMTAAGQPGRVEELDNQFFGFLAKQTPVPGLGPEVATRIGQLNAKVAGSHQCRCSVIAFPPSAPEVVEPDRAASPS